MESINIKCREKLQFTLNKYQRQVRHALVLLRLQRHVVLSGEMLDQPSGNRLLNKVSNTTTNSSAVLNQISRLGICWRVAGSREISYQKRLAHGSSYIMQKNEQHALRKR